MTQTENGQEPITEAFAGESLSGATTLDVGPLLSLAEIARRLDVSYERLRGFADEAAADLGAVKGQGKGWKYPFSSLALFEALITAQDHGEVTPKTAAAWLKRRDERNGEEERAIVPIPQEVPESPRLNLDDLADAIGRGIQEGIRPLLPPLDQASALSGELVEQLKRRAETAEMLVEELRRRAETAEATAADLKERVHVLEEEVERLRLPFWKRR